MSEAAAAAAIWAQAPGFEPRIGLILGSGLGRIAEDLTDTIAFSYADLPGFPVSQVEGHAGRLLLGHLAGVPIACFEGRAHYYEGVKPAAFRAPIRTLKLLGAEGLVVTNAAGGLRPEFGAGRLMLIADHINFLPMNPLIGPNDDEVGTRFPSLRDAYDPEWRGRLKAAARAADVDLGEGVYLAYSGPSFETPAEVRMSRLLGADAIGMSTVPEVIVARHCGLKVAGISALTNLAEGLGDPSPTHEHTLAVGNRLADDLGRLLESFLKGLADG